MKILLVSMNSIHFTRWTQQLRDSGHELHWFNIRSGAVDEQLDFVEQHTDWKYRIKKGRGWIKKTPLLKSYNERNVTIAFEKVLQEIQPDVVHSFALYVSCAPILKVMKTYQDIPWVYSSWGSDLYYFKNQADYLQDIKAVLPHIDYLFTDCKRDHDIAIDLGFKGLYLGVFPGGGGFDLEEIQSVRKPFQERKIIAVKGNENRSGRALNVLKALSMLKNYLFDYEVVVFGATNSSIFNFDNNAIPNLTIKGLISNKEVIRLFGKTRVYIGNSNSDGIPNTMLEAICAGAFPIQSNPGGATEEFIKDGINGLLINDVEDHTAIASIIQRALEDHNMIVKAIDLNDQKVVPSIERSFIRQQVLNAYSRINTTESLNLNSTIEI